MAKISGMGALTKREKTLDKKIAEAEKLKKAKAEKAKKESSVKAKQKKVRQPQEKINIRKAFTGL